MDHGKMEALAKGYSTEDLSSRFEKFFRTYYSREIHKLVQGYPAERSLWVDFRDLDRYDISLSDELISNPDAAIAAAEKALRSIDLPVGLPSIKVNVRFHSLPAINKLMIKDLRSEHVGKFMAVEGIVRKATDVRPKLILGAYECQKCGGVTRISQDGNKVKTPFICEECESRGPFKLLVSESTFLDSQKILIQESLEDLHGGEHPKQLSIHLEDDLTGKITPGDRVELVGVLRAQRKTAKGKASRVFEIFLEANSFKPVQLDFEEVSITPEDEKQIKELSKDPRIYDKIRDSIAPHIYGYADIKEAIMYQLFSSPPLELPDGGRIRGDSHIIIMGEPATGKCVTGDTVLYLAGGGRERIKELIDPIFEDNPACQTEDGRAYIQLREPLFVPAMNDSLKLENRRVTHVWRRKYRGRIFNITTLSGKSIKTTPEHPFFVIRDGNVTCMPAEELVPGERIATPRGPRVLGTVESKESTSWEATPVVTAPINTSPKKLLDKPVLCDGGSPHLENVKLLERLGLSDVFWDEVAGIDVEKIDDYVYDLTVEGCHNFIANGIVVHNSEILQYVAKVLAPRGVYASGKGTSAAGLCVAPSSLVCLDNGVLSSIGDMVEKELGKGKKEYRRGIWIAERPSIYGSTFALNGKAELEPKEIVQYWKLKAPSKVIRIITKTGREIEVTPETPLFSASREGFEWKKAKHLKLGDFLASARDMKTGQKEAPLFIDLIESDPIVYGCEEVVKRAITLLKEKHGLNTRELSKHLGVKEDKLYHAWVNPKAKGKPKLSQVLQLAGSAGISREEVAKAVEGYSLYHGHRITLPVRLNKDFLYFAGLIAGDGDLYKTPYGGCSIRFSNSSPGMLETFKTLAKALFGVDASVKEGSELKPSAVRFHSKLVEEVLQRLGIPFSPKSRRIDLTPELLSLPDELLANYISGLFDCDGCVVSRGDKGSSYLEYVTTSESLAKKLHLSLLRFGIISKLRKRPGKGKKTEFYAGNKRRKIESHHEGYHIYIRGKDNLMAFKEKIGFRHEEKRNALEEVISRIHKGDNYDSVPFAGKVMKNVRKALGLSSREIFDRKIYNHEQSLTKPSTEFVKKFIAKVEELKEGYKDRVYIEINDSLKARLYRRARNYLSRGELSILLGRSEAAVDDYFLRGSRKVRIPYSVLETLCSFLEARGHADCSLQEVGKQVSPSIKDVEERVMKAEKLLKELKTSANVLWDEMVDMEWRSPDYEYVYDLTVHDAHNFLVNGIVSHNTAAAIKDEFGDGGWSLEAGALVLADNGVACLMPESKVVVNDEIHRIEELFDEGHKTRAISHGEEVEICDLNLRTVSMSGLKTLPSVSSRIRRKIYEGEVLEITFNSGFKVRLTPEHKLLHGNSLEWREAREFKRGDFVVAPLKLPNKKDDIYLLDILPDEWKAVLSRDDKEGLRSKVLKKSSFAEFNRRYGISKDFLSGNGSVKVGVLRRILRDLGCYDEWREKPLGYGRKKSGEKLKVSKITPDMAYFLGFLYGDGSVSVSWRRSTVSINQSTKNESQIEAVRRAFTGFSNRKLRVYKRTTRSNIRGDKAEGENLILYAGSNLVAHIYGYITRDGLRNVLKLPDEALKAFIAGCLDSDGCLSIKRGRGYEVTHLEFQLSRDEDRDKAFILALRRFDCYAKLVKGKEVNRILVTGREDITALLDAIRKYSVKTKDLPLRRHRVSSFSGKLPAKQAAEVCRAIASSLNKSVLLDKGVWSTIHAYMNEKYQPAREQLLKIDRRLSGLLGPEIRERIHLLASRDYHLDRIVKIKKIDYSGYVYDLYVPGYHNFLCEGILVHNCIDEFDKMEADDRGAMHEAMEQQSYHHDFEIRLADGRKVRIGDFVEGLMREHRDMVIHTERGAKLFTEPLGFRIYTSSFKENYPATIFSVSRHRAPDRFVRLFFDNGRSITVTPEHPVFVFKNGRIQTEEAEKIREGDHSVAPLDNTYRSDGDVLPVPELKERKDMELHRELIASLDGGTQTIEEAVSPSIRLVKVVKKEILENRDQEWVYDIQVEPTHNFISQGLVLHNSVSIAKAGILATFRSRCSILAAANPKFGRFDDYRSISEQINLPPTILSRFDLIFFVRDSLEETQEVARHILSTVVSPEKAVPKLDPKLLRKYISYARQKVVPQLTEEAKDRIEKFYVEMREMARNAEDVPIPLTARQLWAIVRIARAAARVRLSDKTTLEDVERAIHLIRVSLKQAGLDLETGRVDIDKIMVGVTKSQRDRITRILEVIREIEKEYGSAKKSEIIDRAAEIGIPEVEAVKAIEKLRKDGHIYDPRRDDRYKVV